MRVIEQKARGNSSDANAFRGSAVAAYRSGLLNGRWEAPSPFLAASISVASILQAATLERSEAGRERTIAQAEEWAAAALPPSLRALGSYLDPSDVESPTRAIRTLTELLARHAKQAHSLGNHILDSLALLYPLQSLEGGRILSHSMRTAMRGGRLDLAFDQGRILLGLGRRLRSDELLAKSWMCLFMYGNMRGNLPLMDRANRRSLKHVTPLNDRRLLAEALAHRGVLYGLRGDYGGSVEVCWRSVQLTDYPLARNYTLANIAETLYRSGHFRASRAARAQLLPHCTEPNILFICLGGYAVCCAELGDDAGVIWASNQALALLENVQMDRGVAQGLLGCANACGRVGLDELSRTLYQRGLRLADTHGFHDLRFLPDPTAGPRRTAAPFSGAAEEARRSIVELAPDGVSPDLVLTAVD